LKARYLKFFVIAFFTILLLEPAEGFSQRKTVLDSLKSLLQDNDISGQQRVDILNELAYQHYDINDSIGFVFARQAVKEANKINYQIGLQYAHTLVGIGHFSFGEYNEALLAFSKSDTLSGKGILKTSVYNLYLAGNVLTDIGKFDSANFCFDKALHKMEAKKDNRYVGSIYKGLARLCLKTGRYSEALLYIKQAEQARLLESELQRMDLYTIFPLVYVELNEFDKAFETSEKLCVLANSENDLYHKAMCHLIQAKLHFSRGDYTKALASCTQTMEISKIYSYSLLRAEVYELMGEIYLETSVYHLASDFFFSALKISESTGMDPLNAEIYNSLAWLYKDQSNFPLALDFAKRSELLYQKMNHLRGVSSCQNVRALIYLQQGKYTASIKENEKALAIRERINHPLGVAASLYNLALVYEAMGNYTKALEFKLKCLPIDERFDNVHNLAISYNGIVVSYLKLKQYALAKVYLAKVEPLITKVRSFPLQLGYYTNLAELAEAKGDFKSANAYRKFQLSISDSINSKASSTKLAITQSIYDLNRKEQEIELLSKDRKLQLAKLEAQNSILKTQRYVIGLATALVLAALVFIFLIIRSRKRVNRANAQLQEVNEELTAQSEELKESNDALHTANFTLKEKQEEIETQSEELREANETILHINEKLENNVAERTSQLRQAYVELDTFFYRASHDFRRPITTFLGLAEVAAITINDTNSLDLFGKVKETAQSLDKMIRKLQAISDVGSQDFVVKDIVVSEMLISIIDDFKDEIETKQIKCTHQLHVTVPIRTYLSLIEIIFTNLLENAIQFSSPSNPFIVITTKLVDKDLVISVEDNGQGINEEYHDRIYDMYFRANVNSKGNGLGLYITKKAIQKLGGKIYFTSTLHKGSTFTIEIPNVL
jgi:signal transduction histidine kinase